ncbi:CIA30 family protein [Pseudomarimonas salicorniae]|uniref:CIA30 family protein n=1 Tax=Pseudomarimonas salicorniae TaxID=2933270 RepID=A0ABT0GHQ8_9GAMM|nr:CIA30 family protein [Lysobacter sp. CAU 1642]MCK7593550.1 CIA30 family protein [Lysobacter sp. CAU 1642]
MAVGHRALITAAVCAAALAGLILMRPGSRADETVAAPPAGETYAWRSHFAEHGLQPPLGQPWQASTDARIGGSSAASLKHATEGEEGALIVRGEVGSTAMYPWSGAIWLLGEEPMAAVDARAHREVVIRLRGDGRQLMVMLLSGEPGAPPQMRPVPTGPDWQTRRLALADFAGADPGRLRAVAVAASLPAGPFRFELESLSVQ